MSQKSTLEYVFQMGEGTILWGTKKQPTIAKSLTEGEYMVLWLYHLFAKLGLPNKKSPILIFVDNKGAIDLLKES